MTNPIIDRILDDLFRSSDLSALAERAMRETGATGAAIALKQGDDFVCQASAGDTAPSVGVPLDSQSGLTGACIRSGRSEICDDATSHPLVDATACEQLGVASVIAVPIVRSGQTIGVVEALSRKPHAFGIEQQIALESIAKEVYAEDYSQNLVFHADAEEQLPEDDRANSTSEVNTAGNFGYDPPLEADPSDETEKEDVASSLEQPIRPRRWFLLPVAFVLLVIVLGAYARFGNEPPSPRVPLSTSTTADHRFSPAPALMAAETTPPAAADIDKAVDATAHVSLSASHRGANGVRALEASARAGDAASQLQLASALAQGRGIARDPVEAFVWYTIANMAGEQDASKQLPSLSQRLSNSQIAEVRIRVGKMFWKGVGVPANLTAAYTWFLLAEAIGSSEASRFETRVSREMSDTQITEAKRRADSWLLQHHLASLEHK